MQAEGKIKRCPEFILQPARSQIVGPLCPSHCPGWSGQRPGTMRSCTAFLQTTIWARNFKRTARFGKMASCARRTKGIRTAFLELVGEQSSGSHAVAGRRAQGVFVAVSWTSSASGAAPSPSPRIIILVSAACALACRRASRCLPSASAHDLAKATEALPRDEIINNSRSLRLAGVGGIRPFIPNKTAN